tara:strand:- start:5327 stop:6508 length:1182 start_codon:yes stop_codon:yes gene_type:complete
MNNFDNSKEIKYNYYNNLATPTSSDNHYIYKGKSNQPNIVLIDKGEVKTFATEKFQIKNSDSNPVLIIEHSPITNFDKKVFVHLPLVSNSNKPNDIDHLINNKNKELELNSVLPSSENCVFNECNKGINIKFLSPISINTDLKEYFSNYKEGFQNTVIESKIEKSNGEYSIPENDADGNAISDKVTVGMYIEDPNGELYRIKTKEGNTFTTAPDFSPVDHTPDLLYKFFSMGDRDAEIICDVAPLSTDGTAMYSSQLQTSFDKNKESFIQIFAFFGSVSLLVLWGILIPVVFNYFTEGDNWPNIHSTIKSINIVDCIIIVCGIIAFVVSFSVQWSKLDDDDPSATNLVTFVVIWLTYIFVNCFYRYVLPNKLVSEDYVKNVEDNNAFSHLNVK